ncbi:UNVERIFIED_CONTAM: hypothetical protein Cloal_0356 [Acetivibrio alkalicellulosi]
MKCSFLKEIINYDENSVSIDTNKKLQKHISTCKECKEYLEALMISKKYIVKEPEVNKNFYKQVLNSVDSNRYKKKKINIILMQYFEKLKPVIKYSLGSVAVICAVVIILVSKALISDWDIVGNKKNVDYFNSNETNLNFLQTNGHDIITADGKPFKINGITLTNNFWGNWVEGVSEKLRIEGKDPVVRPQVQDPWVLTENDFERIKNLDCNTVLYGINYELFAEDNPYRSSNMASLKNHINNFASMEIYTAIMLMAPPGLDSTNDLYEMYKPGSIRIKSVFEDDIYYSQWINMWKYIAEELKGFTSVAGYGIINQPRVPSDEDGGIEVFTERLNNICKEIRKIDKKRIIFVPEYNSREANPGEPYWDSITNSYKVDNGDQGIIWERGFVQVKQPNIVYLFHFFEPYDFVTSGINDFDTFALEEQVEHRANWVKGIGNSPMLVEYGISRVNSIDKRLRWLETVHTIFQKYGVSYSYFHYKASAGSYVSMETGFNAIYGEYINWQNEITLKNGSYVFNYEDASQAAKENNFVSALEKYFLKDNVIEPVSLLDNEPIIDSLREFWKQNN